MTESGTSRPGSRYAPAGLVVCALAALFGPRSHAPSEPPGGFLIDNAGQPSALAKHFEPVTLLHFWATWCPPCITEAPALDRLAKDMAMPGRLTVLRVAVADSPDRVRQFLSGGNAEVLFDPKWDVAHRYGTRQLPETYVIVRGKVRQKFAGTADWDDPQLRAQLKAWADERP